MESPLSEWFNASEKFYVLITSWDYKLTVGRTPWTLFKVEGVIKTPSKQQVAMNGEFITLDDRLLKGWSDHPFEVGQVSLFDEEQGGRTLISVDLRMDETCANEVWKTFVLGLCSHDKDAVLLKVVVERPTSDDLKKINDRERSRYQNSLAVRYFSVHVGGDLETSMLDK